ncbi:hypothetical protein MHU86_6321 [Fragilaria crotonensis]|nr:hypothetical protein MHU86_6321 [Fragilaria crotonensis]
MLALWHLKNDKDTRGHWKGKGRVSDCYDDVELPYPDCKVAEKLCMGGACYYVIDNSLCDSNTLKTFVLTKWFQIYVNDFESAAIVLGKAVLWLVYSSVACDFISATDRDRVKADLADTGTVILDGQNPIAKVPIIVSGNQGTVFIDEIQGCRILTVSLLVLITTMWMTMEEHCKDSMRDV